jgi:hypothetical protein
MKSLSKKDVRFEDCIGLKAFTYHKMSCAQTPDQTFQTPKMAYSKKTLKKKEQKDSKNDKNILVKALRALFTTKNCCLLLSYPTHQSSHGT